MAQKDSAVAAARASRDVSPYVLHANTPFRSIWDTTQIFILVYVALAVPYRMGFDADAYGGWYVLEFFVDLYFWIDLCLGFFTAYWEHREEDDEVVYVVDLTRIREHYLQTWFTVDFLACIPVEYISRGLKGLAECSWDVTSNDPCAGERNTLSSGAAAALNFFALLRLLKLLRIARAARIFERYEEYALMYHAQVSMTKLLVVLCLLSHWMACLYGSVYDFAREDYAGANMRPWELYVASLFWAVQTLTTVGYGNVVPQTVPERLLACAVMLLGGFVFSLIIGKVSSLLSEDSAENVEVERSLSLRRFIDNRRVPRALSLRINAFRKQIKENARPGDREVIAELPNHIRADVNFYVYGRVIAAAFAGDVRLNERVVERVCLEMRPVVFTRDLPLAIANGRCDRIAIVTEGTTCVAPAIEKVLKDDGNRETRAYHRELSRRARPGDARLCGPGLLVNPGLALGHARATLCVVPYDKTVEAATWDPEAFKALMKECQPKLARNVADTFFRQLTISRRAAQRLAAQAVGREDLWDETKKGLNSGWHAQLRAERAKEDEAVKLLGDGDGGDAGEKLEGAKLVAADGAEHSAKVEAVQRQVAQMHADVADVGNRVRDSEARSKSASASASADFRKFQDKMIAAMDAQKARVESVESAIDGLHRALQAALDERKSDDKKTRAGETRRSDTVRAATRDGDANPPRVHRALLAREHELAVVLPEIRRGDKEPEARRARSSSRSKSRERGGSPPSPPGDETRL
jgi:hypothetical protein